ncbi:MAG: hypothetical protein JWR54_3361 [Mucilaginibacter sp.]|nr:hypothetical protein [Mucilaginibacter sp.]
MVRRFLLKVTIHQPFTDNLRAEGQRFTFCGLVFYGCLLTNNY